MSEQLSMVGSIINEIVAGYDIESSRPVKMLVFRLIMSEWLTMAEFIIDSKYR
jgi:hypothetical protein